MRKNIDDLRRALAEGASWLDKKKIRWLYPGMAEQRTRVMKAIGPRHAKYDRMEACGTMDENHNNMRLCGVPLCPRCFMLRRKTETAKAIQKQFVGATNDQMAFLTLLVSPTCDLGTVDPCIDATETSLRNIIRYKRRSDVRWNAVQYVGWWEMDRHNANDIHDKLGRNKRIALESEWPVLVHRWDQTVWQPHLHAIVCLGDVPVEEFRQAIRGGGYDNPYQVNVRGFDHKKAVNQNIRDLVRYCMKFRIEEDYKASTSQLMWNGSAFVALRKWWDDKDITAYVGWLMCKRGGFERLKTRLGPKRARSGSK